MKPNLQNPVPAIALRVDDAARVSGLSRSSLYELISSGELPSIKVAGRRLILAVDLEAMLARHRQEAANG